MSGNERRPAGNGAAIGNGVTAHPAEEYVSPIVPQGTDETAWIRSHPARWDVFLRGYESGYRDGYGRGVDVTNQSWNDVTSASCRVGLEFLAAAERQRRRREPGHTLACRQGPVEAHRRCRGCFRSKSASEIREQARRSWAAVEAHLRARQEDHLLAGRRGRVAS